MSTDSTTPGFASITELAALLREGRLSPVGLAGTLLERIAHLDGTLNSFISVWADEALDAAREAGDALARGEDRGPLHGVPVGLKDVFDVAGKPTTYGSRVAGQTPAASDAVVVRRLEESGAVILGKHNLNEFSWGASGENPHFGPVRNPWDPGRIAGGSSAGTAAAVAAGLCVAGLATDTGGSVRIPASLCGVAGLKPTSGLVPAQGVLPLSPTLDHVGSVGRCVEDCALVLEAVADAGRSPPSASGPAAPFTGELARGVEDLVLGVPAPPDLVDVDAAVSTAFAAAVDTLAGRGARIVETRLPDLRRAHAAAAVIAACEAAAWHGQGLTERAHEYGPETLQALRIGALTPATDYLRAQQWRQRVRDDLHAAFERADVILTPTVPLLAPPVGTLASLARLESGTPARWAIGQFTVLANLAGVPAVTVACGRSGGLPVGLQVMGPASADARVVRVAHAYEEVGGWRHQHPQAVERAVADHRQFSMTEQSSVRLDSTGGCWLASPAFAVGAGRMLEGVS